MKIKTFDNQNKGLPTRFQIIDGKFQLMGGKAKVDDNIAMLLCFVGWFRIFKQDYVINAYQLYQNTTSFLYYFKNILRLKIMDIGARYVPFAKFNAVDIPINYTDRKRTEIMIEFTYNLKNVEKDEGGNLQVVKKLINNI